MIAGIIPNRTPVLFQPRACGRLARGHVCGTVTEPDGSLTYRIWDGDGYRHITAERVMPLRNKRRGK